MFDRWQTMVYTINRDELPLLIRRQGELLLP